MNCEHYSEDWDTCTNADCPYCADYCPVTENPEVCRYSGLDDTEQVLRERLDEAVKWREDDLHEFTKKVDVLQKEIERLKKQLVEVTTERDSFMKDWEVMSEIAGAVRKAGAERAAELVEADRDGRCVVLPCKVGDTVYSVLPLCGVNSHRIQKFERNSEGDFASSALMFPFSEFGKTVFRDKEAAEAALERMKSNG